MHACPDAALFAALIAARPNPTRLAEGGPREPDLVDFVLRLSSAVKETTSALREAHACLTSVRGGPRLPGLLARAEAASMEQAECTAALIQHLRPRIVAA